MNFKFKEKTIFKDASLKIFKNRLNIIVGPNGAGKSTLLKIITGNIKTDLKIENDFKNCFYLPQNPYYPSEITTFDYLSLIFYKNNWKWFLSDEEKEKVNKALKLIDLYDKKDLEIKSLSGGEIQKANIALGLLSGAKILILDEPASNMDLINQVKILDMLKELTKKEITSIVIMHDLNLISNYDGNFIGLGYENKIICEDKEKFFTPENLKKLYNIDFEIIHNKERMYVQIIS